MFLYNGPWEHPTSLLAASFRAPSNTYTGQSAALFRTPLNTHTGQLVAFVRVPTKHTQSYQQPFSGSHATGQFIPANHRSVYSDKSQVSLFRPITGLFILTNRR